MINGWDWWGAGLDIRRHEMRSYEGAEIGRGTPDANILKKNEEKYMKVEFPQRRLRDQEHMYRRLTAKISTTSTPHCMRAS